MCSRDFSQEDHKKAAMKNAYVALSKQLFDRAVCFLLLAGHFQDAIQIILKVRVVNLVYDRICMTHS